MRSEARGGGKQSEAVKGGDGSGSGTSGVWRGGSGGGRPVERRVVFVRGGTEERQRGTGVWGGRGGSERETEGNGSDLKCTKVER